MNPTLNLDEIIAMDRALIDMSVNGLEHTETFKAMREIWKGTDGQGVGNAGCWEVALEPEHA